MSTYRSRIYENYGKTFQDTPEHFDRQAARRWGRAQDWYLRHWLPGNKSARIVDLACGAGRLLHYFLEKGYSQVEGVDLSPDQVALSRQIVPGVTQGNVIEFLEAHPAQFDLITGYDIIEHFNKDEALRFLDAAYAALKSGGRLVLKTPNNGGIWDEHRYNDLTHEIGVNANLMRRLLRMVGFQEVEVREADPPPIGYSLLASVRFVLWQVIRWQLLLWNLIENGHAGDGVLTRVFLAAGVKK